MTGKMEPITDLEMALVEPWTFFPKILLRHFFTITRASNGPTRFIAATHWSGGGPRHLRRHGHLAAGPATT